MKRCDALCETRRARVAEHGCLRFARREQKQEDACQCRGEGHGPLPSSHSPFSAALTGIPCPIDKDAGNNRPGDTKYRNDGVVAIRLGYGVCA